MADTLVELKNKKEERADQVRRYVDEYAALALEADRIKQRMDWLKGQFETMATVALKVQAAVHQLLGEPEQPGDGDEHGHGEAHLPDHGEEGAGQCSRGLREVRNRGQND